MDGDEQPAPIRQLGDIVEIRFLLAIERQDFSARTTAQRHGEESESVTASEDELTSDSPHAASGTRKIARHCANLRRLAAIDTNSPNFAVAHERDLTAVR